MRHPSCISAEPRKVRGPSLTSNGSGGSALPPRESPSGLAIQTSRRKHVEQRCSRDEADGTSHRRLAVAAVKGEAECREVDAESALPLRYETVVLGLTKKPFTADSGIVFHPHRTLADAPLLDTLIVPGGSGLRVRCHVAVRVRAAQWR